MNGDLEARRPTNSNSHPRVIGIIIWAYLLEVTLLTEGANVLRTLVFFLLTLFNFQIQLYAESQEIWINPSAHEYTRLSTGLAGSNITIITSEQINSSYNKNLSQILKQYSGIDVRSLYSGMDGKNSTIDMRGFGEAAGSNSLILLNGRRLNDLDMSSVDFSIVPIEAIERIEIIRGSSGSTIYGSGAIGGAINVVTKTGEILDNAINISSSSYNSKKGEFFLTNQINDENALSLSGKLILSDTFRDSADYENESYLLNYNHQKSNLRFYLDILLSDQEQLLSGPRVKGGYYNYHFCNLLSSSKTAKHIGGWDDFNETYGAEYGLNNNLCNVNQRDDYANNENESYSGGIIYNFDSLQKLFFNAAYKEKIQKAFYADNSNTISIPANGDRFVDTVLEGNIFNLRYETRQIDENYSNILNLGIDHSHSFYSSNRHRKEDEPVGQLYDADQKSQAIYFQNTLHLNEPLLTLSLGYRSEKTFFGGRDTVNRSVSGFSFATDHSVYNKKDTNDAYNFGFEKRLNNNFFLLSNYSQGYRTPNIDERIKSTTSGSFELKDQSSENLEIGFRYVDRKLNLNASFFIMDTTNEIQYDQNVNTNLDLINREGINLDFDYKLDNETKLKSSLSIIEAKFAAGSLSMGTGTTELNGVTYHTGNETYGYLSNTAIKYFGSNSMPNQSVSLKGKTVPLVAPLKINILIEREINNHLNLDFEISYMGERYLSNDQENIEPKIPDYYIVNTKIRSNNGSYNLTAGINNLLDESYYDFAVASTMHDDNHYGTQSVYPLAGRNFFIDFGYTF